MLARHRLLIVRYKASYLFWNYLPGQATQGGIQAVISDQYLDKQVRVRRILITEETAFCACPSWYLGLYFISAWIRSINASILVQISNTKVYNVYNISQGPLHRR